MLSRRSEFARFLEFSDLIITDYETAFELCQHAPQGMEAGPFQIVIISDRSGESDIRDALEAGVQGFLLASCRIEEVDDALQHMARGLRYLCRSTSRRLHESLARDPLTERELQVLRCLVDGLVNKTICSELGIALGTVKAHVKAIFDKLGVSTRTQAAAKAKAVGLIRSNKSRSATFNVGLNLGEAGHTTSSTTSGA